jgi:hypothetical protein
MKRAYKLRAFTDFRVRVLPRAALRRLTSAVSRTLRCTCAEEFAAHASTVNCVKIGRRSSGVMVTGGDDKKVNMWAIGKPHAILVRTLMTPSRTTLCRVVFVRSRQPAPACAAALPARCGHARTCTACRARSCAHAAVTRCLRAEPDGAPERR